MLWQNCVRQAAMIDSDVVVMSCDLPDDMSANDASAADNENSHSP
jgi:hypothetical protein